MALKDRMDNESENSINIIPTNNKTYSQQADAVLPVS